MIKPCYYKGERGNKTYDLELMFRLYVLQELYSLLDVATINKVYDSRAFSNFCDVDSPNQIPDSDTLGRFRNILKENGIQERFFADTVSTLQEKGLILKKGTIVDSTIIEAPPSTKNAQKKRDPKAHSIKKGMCGICDIKRISGWIRKADLFTILMSHLRISMTSQKYLSCYSETRKSIWRQWIPWRREAGRSHQTKHTRSKDQV